MGKAYQRKDGFYRKAKEEGYRSRASYKLIEIDKRARLFRKGQRVLDLGCYPGGWLQVASDLAGASGKVVGIDLKEVEPLNREGVIIHKGDISTSENQSMVLSSLGGKADLLLSDMSAPLTGVSFRDACRSAELAELVFELSAPLLKCGGAVVAKVFPSAEADQVFEKYRSSFGSLKRLKLKSTRGSSSELYFLGQKFKGFENLE